MIHVLFTLVLFVAVMGIAMVLFSGWIVVSIARGAARLLGGGKSRRSSRIENVRWCGNTQCRTRCPAETRFCRRCGRSLTGDVARPFSLRPEPAHALQ